MFKKRDFGAYAKDNADEEAADIPKDKKGMEEDDIGFPLEKIAHNIISIEKKDFPEAGELEQEDTVMVVMRGRISNEEKGSLYIEVSEAGIMSCGKQERTSPDAGEDKKKMTSFILHLSKKGDKLEKIFEVPPYSGKVGAITTI